MNHRRTLIGILILVFALSPMLSVTAQNDDTFEIPGLEGSVEVIYDQMGVPHIYADTAHDLFMAQGFIHAYHRWWQMEWWRHLSAGRLSEIAGEATTGNDQFLRTLDFQGAAEKDWALLSDEVKGYLEAYTAGVNAYLEGKEPGELAIEYQFALMAGIHLEVEPWTVYDTLRWTKVMSLSLSGNFETEIFRAQVIDAMGPLGALVILPGYDYDHFPVIVEPGGVDYTGMDADAATFTLPDELDFSDVSFELVGNVDLSDPNITPLGYGTGIGSNSWVISGELTDHGHPMVANDPHLGIQMPSIWYENGLHCRTLSDACPFNVAGVTFAGGPGVIIGHNDNIAWGFTNVGTDVQDLYLLTVNPDNPDQYMLDGEWVDFDIRQETIIVNGGENIDLIIRNSVWGPVMSSFLPVGEQVMALRWVALEGNRNLDSIMQYNKAANWDDFRAAASIFDTAGQNFIYADVEGNIGYQMTGLVPLRAEGHDGTVPVDGSVSTNEWQGYVPWEEMPTIFNPEAGYIVTANNSVVPKDFPYYIADQWAYGYRAARIESMIQNDEDGVYTVEDMQRIHGDNYNSAADFLIPALEALTFEDESLTDAVAWLSAWDRQDHMDSGEAALFNAFWVELLTLAAADDLGFTPGGGSHYMFLVSRFLNSATHPLWDNSNTPDITEGRDDILSQAFAAAVARMVELQGEDRDAWNWGDLHMARFRAAPLGQGVDARLDPMLNSLFNVHVRASGGSAIVNATGWNAGNGFQLTSLPSMRQILIPGDWDSSLRINTLGQSGRPDSRHYKDQVDMWRFIEYHPDWFSREAVEADERATWQLEPAP